MESMFWVEAVYACFEVFAWKERGKSCKATVSTVGGNKAESRTEYLSNSSSMRMFADNYLFQNNCVLLVRKRMVSCFIESFLNIL